MRHGSVLGGEVVAMSALSITRDENALIQLPWEQRVQASIDFDRAISEWSIARHGRKHGTWDWRFDMHRARRAWRHYKMAVRKARAGRIAA